jgi:hypothetical protein
MPFLARRKLFHCYGTSSPSAQSGILQPLGQRREARFAENDLGMLEAEEGEPKVIEAMIQGQASDKDAEIGHVGEIGKRPPNRPVDSPGDHVLLGPAKRPPCNAPLQRAPDTGADLGMPAAQFFEHGNRADARRRSQHRTTSTSQTEASGSGRRS